MSDYIDRQAALNCFNDWIDQHGDVHTADEMVEYQSIEALPAAPVREVKRGRWIQDSYGAMDDGEYLITRCSYCGEANPVSNYCPNCGADMREDGE